MFVFGLLFGVQATVCRAAGNISHLLPVTLIKQRTGQRPETSRAALRKVVSGPLSPSMVSLVLDLNTVGSCSACSPVGEVSVFSE